MRLDLYLVTHGLADSRTKAKAMIEGGGVSVDGNVVTKAAYEVESEDVSVSDEARLPFVGRGGLKLEAALEAFGVDVGGCVCLDIGASTGGFTDCLLTRGASKVYAVDSGTGQLADTLRHDERVISLEGVNARFLNKEMLGGEAMDVVVMDVSFISQTLLYDAIRNAAKPGADVITLIKPQFEAGKANIGKNGIVKDEKVRRRVIEEVRAFAEKIGFTVKGVTESPIKGGSGNTEYLMHMTAPEGNEA